MKKRSKYICVIFAIIIFTLTLVPGVAFADFGPKESVQVTFKNTGNQTFYCTLLSKSDCSGPHSVYEGGEIYSKVDNDVFMAFVNYEDADGFYFLQYVSRCDETQTFTWGYYPPDTFKILLYFPETNTFATSKIYTKYAFSSYFTVDLKGVNGATASSVVLKATKSYDYFAEIVGLLFRVVATVALELGVAWLFKLRSKKAVLCVLITNCITQVVLNVVLNVFNYFDGPFTMILIYFLAEYFVFAAEAVTYSVVLKKVQQSPVPVWKSILYAFVANLLSFVVGMALAVFVPTLF